MLSQDLRNKIDRIWQYFWESGMSNPLTVIQQFTYLLYIKTLDDIELQHESDSELLGTQFDKLFPDRVVIDGVEKDSNILRWHYFKNIDPEEMYLNMSRYVFPYIKDMHDDRNSSYSKYMKDALFEITTPSLLQKVVTGIDQLPIDDSDIKGDLYEYLLSKLSTSKTLGQFRTPRHIIDMMTELVTPQRDDIICDPAVGTAGFLVSSQNYLRRNDPDLFLNKESRDHFNNDMFYGYDTDPSMLRIGVMNMMMHGVENPNLERKDSLSTLNEESEKYTCILANPPFKGSLDAETINPSLLRITNTKKTELLFLALFLRTLQVGGRCASIVPDGVLFGSSNAHKAIRRELIENQQLRAVISMPSGVFKPYAGVSTAVLVFTKTNTGGTNNVWFYDMQSDGYSLDDKRSEIEDNDIPDIIARFKNLKEEENRERTDKSFLVPVQEIVDNDYDLSINKYKKTVYKPVEYESTDVILGKINNLEEEIKKELANLKDLLG